MNQNYTATIKFSNECGDEYELPLSEVQLVTVLKILGITHVKEDEYTCYSDEVLEKFHQLDGNPLRLTIK